MAQFSKKRKRISAISKHVKRHKTTRGVVSPSSKKTSKLASRGTSRAEVEDITDTVCYKMIIKARSNWLPKQGAQNGI